MSKMTKDMEASVRARLLQLARSRGEDFQLLLTRYANERFLFRLAQSPHRSRFVLKGAVLLTIWTREPYRTTRDVDLLGYGNLNLASIRQVFAEILAVKIGDDGIVFDAEALEVGPIREEQEYGGVRIFVRAYIAGARVRLQIDVGFGGVITPEAMEVEYPTLLDSPPLKLLAYPPETVVAEKLEAIVRLGLVNTRMKDFYDLVILLQMFEFEGNVLVRAIRKTFDRRRTPIPSGRPVGLSDEFASDADKHAQWMAFARKTEARDADSLESAVSRIEKFVAQPLAISGSNDPWEAHWPKGGPWSESSMP